jgi:hypothetical protein
MDINTDITNIKCVREGCNFIKHIHTPNNGGTHCCADCKLGNGHGPACYKESFDSVIKAKEKTVGFIILRHVNSANTNLYWNHSYDCIRKFYPENHILIIDDNSNKIFLNERHMYNTTIINSAYPGRGELLPYYYFLYNKLFDIAVIIHDSVFFNRYIHITTEDYKIIWDFNNKYIHNATDVRAMISLFNDKELCSFFEERKNQVFRGCFGGMVIITHDYLQLINNKYNLSLLLEHIKTRSNRMSFERVLGCILQKQKKRPPLLGDVFKYFSLINWDRDIKKYTFENIATYNNLPIVKIWSGR